MAQGKNMIGRNVMSLAVLCAVLVSCTMRNRSSHGYLPAQEVEPVSAGVVFNPDSAYSFIEKQVAFGPRVPGSEAHGKCVGWLAGKLAQYADTVILGKGTVTAFNGTRLPIVNIYGRLNPDNPRRILLLAHYDTRPWADAEKDAAMVDSPIDGANDGASGTGVILELARILKESDSKVGVDFLFVDAEDYGVPQHMDYPDSEDSWCLGTQYWLAGNPWPDGKAPSLAVLLDMVGGKDAVFHREYFSDYAASPVVDAIWATARQAGYGDVFVDSPGNPITDDHVYFLRKGIPAVDIIENNNPYTGSFNPTWHTHADNMDNIDRRTLEAVGGTMHQFILKTGK